MNDTNGHDQDYKEAMRVIQEVRGDITHYGHMGGLNRFQEEAVRYYVKNKYVYDLGAGYLGYAKLLASCEVQGVTAVDSIYADRGNNNLNNLRAWHHSCPDGVILDACYFNEFYKHGPKELDVAFISWPHAQYSKTIGLEMLTRRAKTVVYLGKNTDGTSCGSPQFWEMLTGRKVLCYLPAVRNSLIVYGEPVFSRQLLVDEAAAFNQKNLTSSPKEWPLL